MAMKISRMVDIHLFFKNNGLLSKDYYNKYTAIGERNTAFYSALSTVITSKRQYGIVKTTIDEFLIPKEMWETGIWEKAIEIHGIALCEDSPGNFSAIEIEFTIHVGCNSSLFSGKNLDYDEKHDLMEIRNIDASIDCNTILTNEVE